MKKRIRLRGAKWGQDLQNQLEIRGGRILVRETGEEPLFAIPDGTSVNIIPRDHAVRLVDEAKMYQCFGA